MLKLIIDKSYNKYSLMDMEKEFDMSGPIKDNKLSRKAIQEIEEGEYCDEHSIIDRFGYKLYRENISTGCKTALVLANNPNAIVDETEIGPNARDSIIRNFNQGTLILRRDGLTVANYYDKDYNITNTDKIDVECDGYHFTSLKSLNQYLFIGCEDEPDEDDPGVTKL